MSRKIENLAQDTRDLILKAARGANYWGKRLDDSRLSCVEGILGSLDLAGSVEARDLVSWLDENKPVPEKKANNKTNNKAAANTIVSGSAVPLAKTLPVYDDHRVYVITSAQNNTDVNRGAWDSLKGIAGDLGAEIIVLPFWYNKSAFSAAKESPRESFAEEIRPFMLDEHGDCFLWSRNAVKLVASAAIVPTAKLPVNAAKQLNTGEGLTLVGSPKQQLEMMPELNEVIRAGVSTGTVTSINYTRSRAGAEAEADHCFGGVIVWVDQSGVNITQLQYIDGRIEVAIPELDFSNCRDAPALKLGDLHCEKFDRECWDSTLEIVEWLAPEFVAVDDILHFESRSHHNRHSGKHLYCAQGVTVLDELTQVIAQLNQLAALVPDLYVTESNHNSAIDVWLDDKSYSVKNDPVNAKLYYLLNWALCEAIDSGEDHFSALKLALEGINGSDLPTILDNIRFGRGDVSEIVHGTDFSQHGHKGQNGSLGSPKLFAKWQTALATGHTHSPSQYGRVITSGVTARKDQGYNRLGASSWAQAHSIVYSNGAQGHIFIEKFPR